MLEPHRGLSDAHCLFNDSLSSHEAGTFMLRKSATNIEETAANFGSRLSASTAIESERSHDVDAGTGR